MVAVHIQDDQLHAAISSMWTLRRHKQLIGGAVTCCEALYLPLEPSGHGDESPRAPDGHYEPQLFVFMLHSSLDVPRVAHQGNQSRGTLASGSNTFAWQSGLDGA